MSSIVIAGDTSGSVTLQAPAVAGATVITLPSTSTTLVSSQWTTASSDIYYTTGNVGIGTTSPATKLHVSTSSGSEVLRIESTSNPLFTIYNAGTREFYIQTQSVIDLWGQANKAMRFGTNDIERLRITSAGDVGIGTTSPSAKLDVAGSAYVRGDSTNGTFTGPGQLAIKRSSGDPVLSFHGNTGAQIGNIQFQDAGTCTIGVNVNQALAFTTNSTERARIDTSGNLLVGTTSVVLSGKLTTSFTGNTINGATFDDTGNGNGAGFITFSESGTAIGNISRVSTTSAVAYNTTSDQRLKSNVTDSESVIDKLMQVKVRQYDWTQGAVHQDYGFIAQELKPLLSGIVTEGKTEEDMWQLDYSKLTPHLVKAIQEQQAIIESLKARLDAANL